MKKFRNEKQQEDLYFYRRTEIKESTPAGKWITLIIYSFSKSKPVAFPREICYILPALRQEIFNRNN